VSAFTWNPAWASASDSIVSIANKLAVANDTSVRRVLHWLVEGDVHQRQSVWVPSARVAIGVAHKLGLDVRSIRTRFFGVQGGPVERRALRIGVRWCPQCVVEFRHNADCQRQGRATCPEHGVLIHDGCPACGTLFDPFGDVPWSCSACGTRVAQTPWNWPAAYRGEGRLRAQPAPVGQLPATASAELAAIFWCEGHVDEQRVRALAFEEFSALADDLLGPHRLCVAKQPDVSMTRFSPAHFGCPASAAIQRAAAWAGVQLEAEGGWPDHRAGADTLFPLVLAAVRMRPKAQVASRLSQLARSWVLEAFHQLEVDTNATPGSSDWRPTAPRRPPDRAIPSDPWPIPAVSDEQLVNAARHLYHRCRWAPKSVTCTSF
jgi:hypothetical protein